jgi:hypothetical protein
LDSGLNGICSVKFDVDDPNKSLLIESGQWRYDPQQQVCSIAGFRVEITFQFHYIHLSRPTSRNWSGLTFR